VEPATPEPYLIGWKEYVDFPDWPIGRVKAKIDTGARTSVLDVAAYVITEGIVCMTLILDRKRGRRRHVIATPLLRFVEVCNTGGALESRPLIQTTIRLGPVTKRINLTLTDRTDMRFRLLLGRKALEGDFVVDVSRKYLLK